jgi:hypothetical protein
MPDTYPSLERACDASAPVRICRADGSEVPVQLRLLSFDGCELESSKRFKAGEQVRIHLYGMGWKLARIVSCRSNVVEADFIRESPSDPKFGHV